MSFFICVATPFFFPHHCSTIVTALAPQLLISKPSRRIMSLMKFAILIIASTYRLSQQYRGELINSFLFKILFWISGEVKFWFFLFRRFENTGSSSGRGRGRGNPSRAREPRHKLIVIRRALIWLCTSAITFYHFRNSLR